ncbi:MAG: hypothetical protein K1563_18495, partial [Candidatus Thiodiazotropha sp. (ex. Lucinisca nassula)]|nr:hypothetical protein [Candidatus Thiodiazotropha sp. (ex. Lucinisca nassula)]
RSQSTGFAVKVNGTAMIQGEKYWSSNLWLYQSNWGIDSTKINHCPECARMCFHSHAFNHNWVNYCPIHNDVILASKCPECNTSWPREFKIFYRKDCKTCGLVRPQSNTERKQLTHPHTAQQTKVLSVIWKLRKFDSQLCQLLYHDFINFGLDSGILLGNRYFPDYACSVLPNIADALSCVTKSLNIMPMLEVDIEKIHDNSQVTDNDILIAYPNYVKREIDKTIGNLVIALRENGVIVTDEETCHPLYFDINDPYCPAKMSFLVWKSIICGFKNNVYSHQSWNRVFDILNIKKPSFPPIVHLIYHPITRTFYTPSTHFCIWMFNNNLKCLYDYIYQHFTYFKLKIVHDDKYLYSNCMLSKYIQESESPPTCFETYKNYRLNITNNSNLVVIHKPVQAWDDLVRNHFCVSKRTTDLIPNYDNAYRRLIFTKVSPDLLKAIDMEANYFCYP